MAIGNGSSSGTGSGSASGSGGRRAGRKSTNNTPFKGIRMRKWGKWVAEIREPNKNTRLWLGSYFTPVAAARAYDTALYLLRGPNAGLNFPNHVPPPVVMMRDLSPDAIKRMAVEIGGRVDAMQAEAEQHAAVPAVNPAQNHEAAAAIDLNRNPDQGHDDA